MGSHKARAQEGVRTYSVQEFGQLLGISRQHAYTLAKAGEIAGVPAIKVGNALLFPRAQVDRLLDGEPQQNEGD